MGMWWRRHLGGGFELQVSRTENRLNRTESSGLLPGGFLPRGGGIIARMKAHVWVMLKPTVLDPQGQTIQHALASLGFRSVREVRQGKFFVLELDGLDRAEASRQVEQIAREVLANPVIEQFRFEILE
jgi:phosphoribosylformylglycinamidine synthase PurS subunit